jgi:hypothetical protein
MEEVLKDTERCPYTSIRELIIAFKRTDPFTTDVQFSDTLMAKYTSNSQLHQVDKNLSSCINEIENSQIRFEKLYKCAEYYNNLKGGLSKREEDSDQEFQGDQTSAKDREMVYSRQNEAALRKEDLYF